MSVDILKSDVDKPFKLSGLFLAPDASLYLLSIVQRVEPSKRQKVPHFEYSKSLKKFVLLESNETRQIFPILAKSKAFMYAHRYEVIHQRMLRHQVFSEVSSKSLNDSGYRLHPIEFLLASGGRIDMVVILGMITQLREGEWHAEDPTGIVRLNLKQAVFHEGLFPEGSIVLVEGYYEDKILYVTAIGLPPCESSDVSRRAFSVSNPFGAGPPGALAAPQDAKMHKLLTNTQAGADAMIVFVGETPLDNAECMERLDTMFGGYSSCPPVAFVLTGNFLSCKSFGRSCTKRRLLLGRFIIQLIRLFETHFSHHQQSTPPSQNDPSMPQLILVPGPNDPVCAPTHIYPRPTLLPNPQDPHNDLLRFACPSWLRFVSNPVRIRLYTREIVVIRCDYSRLLVRHCLYLPSYKQLDDEQGEESLNESIVDGDMSAMSHSQAATKSPSKSHPADRLGQSLARCLSSQCHLLPVANHIGPVYWGHDQAMSIHPLPSLVVAVEPDPLADVNRAKCGLVATSNCQFVNPGRFGQMTVGDDWGSSKTYSFKVYYPQSGLVEDSCLPA